MILSRRVCSAGWGEVAEKAAFVGRQSHKEVDSEGQVGRHPMRCGLRASFFYGTISPLRAAIGGRENPVPARPPLSSPDQVPRRDSSARSLGFAGDKLGMDTPNSLGMSSL
jgi:hypothetical protein